MLFDVRVAGSSDAEQHGRVRPARDLRVCAIGRQVLQITPPLTVSLHTIQCRALGWYALCVSPLLSALAKYPHPIT